MRSLLRMDPVDLDALGHMAQVVAKIRASDRLIPVARQLLMATEPRHIKLGISLAQSLAKEVLKPELIGLLDSPDANIRNAAKAALKSIAEWSKFKEAMKK